MSPPTEKFLDQKPLGIPQTNWIPWVLILVLVGGLLFFGVYRMQASQKIIVIENNPRPRADVSGKVQIPDFILNEDKIKNFKIEHYELVANPQTLTEVEKQDNKTQQINYEKEVIEDQYATQLEIEKIEEKNKIDQKKLELQAMEAPLNIDVPKAPQGQSNQTEPSAIADDLKQLAVAQNALGNIKIPDPPGKTVDSNFQDEKEDFVKNGVSEGDYLKHTKMKPVSPFEVKAGTYITAALETGIDSDLPGSIKAQVSENVYDTVTGNYILIPQGAKIIGQYDSKVSFGQNRALVVWNRIIFPDGSSIDLEKMSGVDISGYAGFKDKLDNHYLKIYGNAVLLSLVGAGYDILNQSAQQQQGYESPRDIVAANVGQKLSDVSDKTLEKNMDVQPTITIRPGYKFKIIVMKDMILEKINDVEGTLSYTN